eukprot:700610-Prymnesium_polylepis.3
MQKTVKSAEPEVEKCSASSTSRPHFRPDLLSILGVYSLIQVPLHASVAMGWMVGRHTRYAVRGRKRPQAQRATQGEVCVITPRSRGEHTRDAHLARSITRVLSPFSKVWNVLARQL